MALLVLALAAEDDDHDDALGRGLRESGAEAG